jgi:hypothetical protein
VEAFEPAHSAQGVGIAQFPVQMTVAEPEENALPIANPPVTKSNPRFAIAFRTRVEAKPDLLLYEPDG